jgi:hypothetical protein
VTPVTVRPVGTLPDTAVVSDTEVDYGPVLPEPTAATVNVYAVPDVRPVTV